MTKYFAGLILVLTILSCKKSNNTPAGPVIDKIRLALSTSQAGYDALAANYWLNITAAEYNNLLITVTGSARYAEPEVFMTTSSTGGWSGDYTTGGSDKSVKVPASSYIIAWSVETGNAISSSLNSKLKISATQKAGYTDYGKPLPDIGNIATSTRVYFVLKTPNIITPAAPCYTAVYTSSVFFLGNVTNAGSGPEYYTSGDSPSLTSSFASDSYSQVISTPTRQW
jgi:hypothetical protein